MAAQITDPALADPALAATARMLASLPLPSVFFILLTGCARALGALFGLWGMYFALGPAVVLRTGIAAALSLPLMAGFAPDLILLAEDLPRVALLSLPLREFFIGFGIGLLASLPFFALLGASIIIDQYRGDFSPGLQAPENQQVGSYANLTVVMALYLFAEAGGFAVLVTTLYKSTALLPPGPFLPAPLPNATTALSEILQQVFWRLLVVAMPALVILFLIDFAVNLTFRLAGQIKLPSAEFLLKSLLFITALPFLALGLERLIDLSLTQAPEPLLLLRDMLGSR